MIKQKEDSTLIWKVFYITDTVQRRVIKIKESTTLKRDTQEYPKWKETHHLNLAKVKIQRDLICHHIFWHLESVYLFLIIISLKKISQRQPLQQLQSGVVYCWWRGQTIVQAQWDLLEEDQGKHQPHQLLIITFHHRLGKYTRYYYNFVVWWIW